MLTQLKAIFATVITLVLLIIIGTAYWSGRLAQATKADLRVARETIKVEREALKITHTIDMRVNAEGIQTAKTAQEAASEIEAIRSVALPRNAVSVVRESSSQADATGCDSACTRVLQLAREARAAALASGARLQSEGAGPR